MVYFFSINRMLKSIRNFIRMVSMNKTIVFTGGGSAGHVTPNIALMRELKREGYDIHYIGTSDGIERELVSAERYAHYHVICAGKLRRYFSVKNLTDAIKVVRGTSQANKIIKDLKPVLLFSKGGFVSVPVVLAAKNRCPIVAHESDYTPGLSNRIANRYASTICVTFEDTLKYTGEKGVFTGTPIRNELYQGDRRNGFLFTGFNENLPVLLMMGGSLGAQAINEALRGALPDLLTQFQIIHICGKGKLSDSHNNLPRYKQYEYIKDELPDLFAIADIILSRAGANAIFEFLALKKPALLIPLPLNASRGDQILNANYFTKKGYATSLMQEDLSPSSLKSALYALYLNRAKYIAAMESEKNADGTHAVLDVLHSKLSKYL